MLLKKILRLKKKTDQISEAVANANNFLKDYDKSKKEIGLLKNKIALLEEKLNLQEKSHESQCVRIEDVVSSVLDLQEYKDTCTRDIPILASAITEVYNIINYALEDQLLNHSDSDLNSIDSILSHDNCEDSHVAKKKKKIYH